MVLTNAQTQAFFSEAAQMGLEAATIAFLTTEGISTVNDLAEFSKDDIDNLAKSIRGDPAGVVFGIKSQKRLIVSSNLIRFYDLVGRPISASNLRWDTVGKNFDAVWKALEQKAEKDEPDVPKITKQVSVMKWATAFDDHLHACLGALQAPLAWITRPEAAVPAIGARAVNAPHSEQHGSIEGDMINRIPHTNPLFRNDNEAVYQKLEIATRNTQYAAAIAPFNRRKDGRTAHQAIISQFAGPDKWEAEYKAKELILHTYKWKGQSNHSLEAFVSIHRNCFVSMTACSQKITVQLPNEFSRVGYLLDSIECADPQLQAAMAQVRQDKTPLTGLRNNFENAVAQLLPSDPVARKRTRSTSRNVSSATSEEGTVSVNISSMEKVGKGSTGVHLRYHTVEEYRALSKAQRSELYEWRRNDPSASLLDSSGKKRKLDKAAAPNKSPKTRKVTFSDKVMASVDAALEARLQAAKEAEFNENMTKAYIQGLVTETMTGKRPSVPSQSTSVSTVGAQAQPVPSLTQIMERVKNVNLK